MTVLDDVAKFVTRPSLEGVCDDCFVPSKSPFAAEWRHPISRH